MQQLDRIIELREAGIIDELFNTGLISTSTVMHINIAADFHKLAQTETEKDARQKVMKRYRASRPLFYKAINRFK